MTNIASNTHLVLGSSMHEPYPDDCAIVLFGMGCFWGAERRFWQQEYVYTTSVGYAGGAITDPGYELVCTGTTGHAEVVKVVYRNEPQVLRELLRVFWESHDPTQGMRQGNDVGSQYRSVIFTETEEQYHAAIASRDLFEKSLSNSGFGNVTTEIQNGVSFYFAEDYHQQYLAKNPNGYCGLRGTGVSYSPGC